MELRDVRAFVMLGEVLHFGQAALRLHVTQSALSKQIQRLESDWGGALFERRGNVTRLTALGASLLPSAQQLLAAAAQLQRDARDGVAGIAGRLRIGFGVAAKHLLPEAIERFRATRPKVRIDLFDLSTHHQIQRLVGGELDIGICRLPAPDGWPVLPVARACFVAVVPRAWMTDGVVPDLARLATQPLTTTARTGAPGFHDHLMAYLAGESVRLSALQPVSDFVSAVALAAAGVAWAVVPSSIAIDSERVVAVPLTASAASWRVGLMRPPGATEPLIDAFWQVMAVLVAETGLN